MAFWVTWIAFTLFVIWFFYVNGVLQYMDFGKSVILTVIPLMVAYPIYRWIKNNDDLD
ncbi:hypothetical protein [Thalassotalea sediminis]|uniref:hypothetical protein n=1 Tax=Thalassotalea sediminis TaxID=1759089 RepID=UPI00257443AF|nr:hypothetical protein [Thalassotalea sediminis]